jgi:hypothetical protein
LQLLTDVEPDSGSRCGTKGLVSRPVSRSLLVVWVQSLGLCFYPHLKCRKRFIVLLPGTPVRIADDECRGAGLSLSYDAIASRREYGFHNYVHHYKWTPSEP